MNRNIGQKRVNGIKPEEPKDEKAGQEKKDTEYITKRSTIGISGTTEAEQKKNGTEAMFEEFMSVNFSTLMKPFFRLTEKYLHALPHKHKNRNSHLGTSCRLLKRGPQIL